LSAKTAKDWLTKNAKQDQSTRRIIPEQVIRHPDGITIFIVRSPDSPSTVATGHKDAAPYL
jgi:hypothetical protein